MSITPKWERDCYSFIDKYQNDQDVKSEFKDKLKELESILKDFELAQSSEKKDLREKVFTYVKEMNAEQSISTGQVFDRIIHRRLERIANEIESEIELSSFSSVLPSPRRPLNRGLMEQRARRIGQEEETVAEVPSDKKTSQKIPLEGRPSVKHVPLRRRMGERNESLVALRLKREEEKEVQASSNEKASPNDLVGTRLSPRRASPREHTKAHEEKETKDGQLTPLQSSKKKGFSLSSSSNKTSRENKLPTVTSGLGKKKKLAKAQDSMLKKTIRGRHATDILGNTIVATVGGEPVKLVTNKENLTVYRGYVVTKEDFNFNRVQEEGYDAPYIFWQSQKELVLEENVVRDVNIHQSENPKHSAFISTTKDIDVSITFLRTQLRLNEQIKLGAIDIYHLPEHRGVDIVQTLGNDAKYPDEQEVAVPGKIRSKNYAGTIVFDLSYQKDESGNETFVFSPKNFIVNLKGMPESQTKALAGPKILGTLADLLIRRSEFKSVPLDIPQLLDIFKNSTGYSFYDLNVSATSLDDFYHLVVSKGLDSVSALIEYDAAAFKSSRAYQRMLAIDPDNEELKKLIYQYKDTAEVEAFIKELKETRQQADNLKFFSYYFPDYQHSAEMQESKELVMNKQELAKGKKELKTFIENIKRNPHLAFYMELVKTLGPVFTEAMKSSDKELHQMIFKLASIIRTDGELRTILEKTILEMKEMEMESDYRDQNILDRCDHLLKYMGV